MLPVISCGRPARSALNRSNLRSSSGKTLYFAGLHHEEPLQVVHAFGMLVDHVPRLGPVVGCVELPHVVVEGGQLLARLPRGGVPRHRGPAPVVDAAVHEHLEVLGLVALRGVRLVEGVEHARALERCLLDPVHEARMRQPCCLQDGRGHVDDMGELGAHLALGRDAVGPVDDGAVAGAAPVGGDLLGPLVGRVHGVRPTDGVVVVGARRAEVVDPAGHELDRLERAGSVERDRLVERAVDRALRGGAVVPDDDVDERVVEDPEVGQGVDQPADVVIGVLEEAGVHLHLARQHRLQVIGHVVPGGDLRGSRRSAPHPARRCPPPVAAARSPRAARPTLRRRPGVAIRELLRDVVGCVGGAGGEVGEERLVGRQRLLLSDPLDGPVGHVLVKWYSSPSTRSGSIGTVSR